MRDLPSGYVNCKSCGRMAIRAGHEAIAAGLREMLTANSGGQP